MRFMGGPPTHPVEQEEEEEEEAPDIIRPRGEKQKVNLRGSIPLFSLPEEMFFCCGNGEKRGKWREMCPYLIRKANGEWFRGNRGGCDCAGRGHSYPNL